MVKAIAAVIAGFILMSLIVFGGLGGAFIALGPDRTYQPGTWEITGTWIAANLVVDVIAALAGGCLCRVIAGRPKPVIVLAVLVLVFGGLSAGFEMAERGGATADAPAERPADITMTEAMTSAKPPIWLMWANAGIGFVGVLVGGGRKVKAAAGQS